jgi:hypothetical protein
MAKKQRTYTSAAGKDDAATTEGLQFTLDDREFTCHGRISAFDLAEFAGPVADAGNADTADPAVLRILSDFLRTVMGEQTYAQFTKHRRVHKTPDEVVQQIMYDIIEDASDRPTNAPAPSPAGPGGPALAPAVLPSPASAVPVTEAPVTTGAQVTVTAGGQVPVMTITGTAETVSPEGSTPGYLEEDLADLAAAGDIEYAPPGGPQDERPAGDRTISFAHPERGVRPTAASQP